MSLRTIVKVSHISNLSDARYCAGMGVEMLGVGVIPSHENYLTPAVFQDIRGWIAGPKIVGELYGVTTPEEIESVRHTYAPDYFELTLEEYKRFGHLLFLPCLVYLPPGQIRNFLAKGGQNISHFLVDEGTSCGDISGAVPVLIKITSLNTLHEKLAEGCFKGIALEGAKESRPGITNYEQLGDLLEALEERES